MDKTSLQKYIFCKSLILLIPLNIMLYVAVWINLELKNKKMVMFLTWWLEQK